MTGGRGAFWLIFSALGAVVVLFIGLPLAAMIASTDPRVLWSTLQEPEVRQSLSLTLSCGLWATATALICGVPLAYVLARWDFPAKGLVESLIDLPVVMPHTAAGIALMTVLGRRFYAGRLFERLGVGFVGAKAGIVVAMAFVSVPFLIRSARDGFAAVDPRLEQLAQTLGAGPWTAFRRVALPLASRNILTGALLMWARAISEFGAVMILAYHPMVAPVMIWDRFEAYGLDYAKSMAVLLLLLCLAIFGALRWTVGAGRGLWRLP